ncbi:MAG: hypothetical protein HC803_04385 [Saprospiraceae bacterium]|nr:hypothetical protein [Saprospiraceae bacterium]
MELNIQSPKQAVSRSFGTYQRKKISPSDFEAFVNALDNYFYYSNRAKNLAEKTEPHLLDFFKFFFPNAHHSAKEYGDKIFINAISENEKMTAEILIYNVDYNEPKNMVSVENANVKSLHNLIIAYLSEVIENENQTLKTGIITDTESFYIIDFQDFKSIINTEILITEFKNWKGENESETATKAFYKAIKNAIQSNEIDLSTIYFNLNEYQNPS